MEMRREAWTSRDIDSRFDSHHHPGLQSRKVSANTKWYREERIVQTFDFDNARSTRVNLYLS